ncbi:MAG: DUF4126 domain-containing protein [Brevundimonas sp.]|uniref:DUF4126 domain-containing protein n=1 Tax=Brevundimonas sp. TaxID=1871086 RepID=UPI0027332760|nr:DUF4126 domain-containing protein [Brevundimonas sp.]MDP3377836.1 DUF4126 domain-containing protein [Brevundimonas sp.]
MTGDILQGLPASGILETWVLPVLLALGLAAASGLRIFVPLFMAALAAKFQLFGIELNDGMLWMTSNTAIAALGLATVIEIVSDKVPVLDNALHAIGLIARPVAGALVAGSMFVGLDPTAAAIAGIIVGAPTALAFGAAQGGTRAASTLSTAGMANPLLSVVDDLVSVGTVMIAFLMPLLIPVVILIGFLVLRAVYNHWRKDHRTPATVPTLSARRRT